MMITMSLFWRKPQLKLHPLKEFHLEIDTILKWGVVKEGDIINEGLTRRRFIIGKWKCFSKWSRNITAKMAERIVRLV